MLMLKIIKVFSPVCDVKISNSLSVSGKLRTLGLFFVENKDQTKTKFG